MKMQVNREPRSLIYLFLFGAFLCSIGLFAAPETEKPTFFRSVVEVIAKNPNEKKILHQKEVMMVVDNLTPSNIGEIMNTEIDYGGSKKTIGEVVRLNLNTQKIKKMPPDRLSTRIPAKYLHFHLDVKKSRKQGVAVLKVCEILCNAIGGDKDITLKDLINLSVLNTGGEPIQLLEIGYFSLQGTNTKSPFSKVPKE
jgi:hypothetical protein